MRYFNCHTHTMYSNIRLLDSINEPTDLINKAIELGLSGVAITDHECISSHLEVNQLAKKIKETNPDFTIALGNEIYLTNNRESGQKYYHFIILAKDALGHKCIRELSSIAWYNIYTDRRLERVPTVKSELEEVLKKYKGHVIATSACIGGELGSCLLKIKNLKTADLSPEAKYEEKIQLVKQMKDYIEFCQRVFGKDDFYIECAPSTQSEQIYVNKNLMALAKEYDIKVVVGTDAHYLRPEDRWVHKAYLNSKDGDREIDSFYEFTYLMTPQECHDLLLQSYGEEEIQDIFNNSLSLQKKIDFYSLERKQIIPKIKVENYSPVNFIMYNQLSDFPLLEELFKSDEVQERYWINECLKSLREKNLYNKIYLNRINIEADIIKCIGEKLDDCLFAYFNTFKHYIDLFWECGSIVGPGRGSATGFLSNYLLGITQLDPIRWELPYWRFLNKERIELPDIDIDLAPSKRKAIFKAIREERGEFGLVQVATFGTEGTKSAILTACRGYRSDDCPDGIDVDVAQYMSSLIPQERGFLWDINDVINGNPAKDRKPVVSFLREVNNYPGLLKIIISICGLVNKRSTHASGVILYGQDPYETAAFMRTPGQDLITCYDLHKAEAAGDTKYDFLVTEISDKIIITFDLLKADNEIENLSLRDLYNKYLHPEIIDTENQELWKHLAAGDVLDVFQFNTGVGLAIAKKIKPQNPMEMVAANAMMRLMSEKGKESQQDRFARIQKQGIEVFDLEMRNHNLSEEVIALMHKHCDKYYGCCPIQEQMMEILMDVAHFTLGEANSARKVVAKKQMSKIPELKTQFYEKIQDDEAAKYLWEIAIAPQLGYAFSLNHSLPYSFVGMQTLYLASTYNPIYWNTACLIVNSGATDEDNGGSTDYGKIAKAIGDIGQAGIQVSIIDINKSKYSFVPDVENNTILFGMKGLLNVGDDIISNIIINRPYESIKDFYYKVKPSKQTMISLIKSGAFDQMEDRKFAMAWYLWTVCDKKSTVNLRNMAALIDNELLPQDDETIMLSQSVYEFNRYLKAVCNSDMDYYVLDDRALQFLVSKLNATNIIENNTFLHKKTWEKVYNSYLNPLRTYIAENVDELKNKLNTIAFLKEWNKYAIGNISGWEMEVMGFYYNEHELAHVDFERYGLSKFYSLPEEPLVEKSFFRGQQKINMFKLSRICGTCIAKDKTKSTVTLLTTDGVVTVKFPKDYFSMFNKQISARGADGNKHVIEKSWFNRGNMIVVTGMRSGDDFISKKYASTGGHQLYKIDEVRPDGTITLRNERYRGELEDDED